MHFYLNPCILSSITFLMLTNYCSLANNKEWWNFIGWKFNSHTINLSKFSSKIANYGIKNLRGTAWCKSSYFELISMKTWAWLVLMLQELKIFRGNKFSYYFQTSVICDKMPFNGVHYGNWGETTSCMLCMQFWFGLQHKML